MDIDLEMSLSNEEQDAQTLISQNTEHITTDSQILVSSELLQKSDTTNLSAHNKQYTLLLQSYINYFNVTSKDKRKNKKILFTISMILLVGIPVVTILIMLIILYCLATDKIDVFESLPELIATLSTLFGTFIIIPKMITKYLFNKKEDDHLANIISKIQEYDKNIRDGL